MAIPIRLDPHQLEDLKVILELGPEKLRDVVERVRRLKSAPISPDKLFGAVADVLGERKDAAESLVREALTLYRWIRQGGCTVQQLFEGIRDNIQADSDWTKGQLEKWGNVEAHFGEFLSLPIIRLVASAIDLSYEYANLFLGARILTDIRPIFDNDAAAIEGAVVSYTLRLRFGSSEGHHELNIAMDHSDIKDLAVQCDRAIRKAKTARDLMQDAARIPTVISGGGDDA